MADTESRREAVPYQVRLQHGRMERTDLVGADTVGLRLPNGMELELRWDPEDPRRVRLYTGTGTLALDLTRTAANVVGVLGIRERERLAVVDARSGEVVP